MQLLTAGLDPCLSWGVTCQAEFGTGSAWLKDILFNLEVLFHSEMHLWQLQRSEAVELPSLMPESQPLFPEKETGLQTVLLIKYFFSS